MATAFENTYTQVTYDLAKSLLDPAMLKGLSDSHAFAEIFKVASEQAKLAKADMPPSKAKSIGPEYALFNALPIEEEEHIPILGVDKELPEAPERAAPAEGPE